MKGRAEAVLATTFATGTVLFAWVGAAVVALVTLRKGPKQGLYVLFWGLLPALVLVVWDDPMPLVTLLGVMLVALVLRVTASWPLTLIAAVVSGLLMGLTMLTLGHSYIEEILKLLADIFAQMAKQQPTAPELSTPSSNQVAGLLGLGHSFTVVMCLILARWWQAVLYNPGGFSSEYQQLRLSPTLTAVLLVAVLLVSSLGADYRFWAMLFTLPFIFTGFALVHGVAAQKRIDGTWLGMFYFCWLVLDPLKALLIIIAVADSWLNIRARLGNSQR